MLVFPVKSYPWRTLTVTIALTIGLPLLIIALMLILAGVVASWLFVLGVATAIGFLLSMNVALMVLTVYVATRNEITVRNATLHLKTSEFHERVPLESIQAVEVIDLDARARLARLKRRNGVMLPGFRAGWFHDREELVFVLRTTQRRLLYIQTDRGFNVLLGLQDPAAVAATLRAPKTAAAH